MRGFAVEPNSVHEFGSKTITIRLGNALSRRAYFAIRYYEYSNTWEIPAVPKSFYDGLTPPLGETRHAPTDTVD